MSVDWKKIKNISKDFFEEVWNAKFLVLPVFIVSYGITKCIREITRGSIMCH